MRSCARAESSECYDAKAMVEWEAWWWCSPGGGGLGGESALVAGLGRGDNALSKASLVVCSRLVERPLEPE